MLLHLRLTLCYQIFTFPNPKKLRKLQKFCHKSCLLAKLKNMLNVDDVSILNFCNVSKNRNFLCARAQFPRGKDAKLFYLNRGKSFINKQR